jgi:signal transduction histidine kinase
MIAANFDDFIAERMRLEHRPLADRWFERLLDLLPVDAREIFPTETLLDHIPGLILEIGAYLQRPDNEAVAANTTIMEKARELGALRHGQRASLHQVLREYHILGAVLVNFVREEIDALSAPPPAAVCVALIARLNQAVNVLSQATVETFVTLYTQTISEQNDRLEQFTRMAAHEWRQPLGTLQFGVSILRRGELDPSRSDRIWDAVDRNVHRLVELTRKLEAIARLQGAGDNPLVQTVPATTVIHEAARQLREMAEARGVRITIADNLPTVTVDVGRLELVAVNLLSNAVKYSDPAKADRYVEVAGGIDPDGCCRIEVRDNGVGIPERSLASIFQRFARAHVGRDDLSHVAGVGLGLAIAEDCVRAMGGRIDVRSIENEGTVFAVVLPPAPVAV